MQLRLKTKFTLSTALLVLLVAALISSVGVAWLADQVIIRTMDQAKFVTEQVFLQAQEAVKDATNTGDYPASDAVEDLHMFVKQALADNDGLHSSINASVGHEPSIYEVSIVDHGRNVLISSDTSLIGQSAIARPPLSDLADASFIEQFRVLYGPPRVYEISKAFNVGRHAFGEIRISLSTALLRSQIEPELQKAALLALALVAVSTVFAAVVSHVTLSPLSRISAQLDRIARGEFEPADAEASIAEEEPPSGELGQVSTKITRIGEQLRGVQEIFGTLRENIDQVMAGMDDGLILFTRDARAVLVSPSVEKFLGVPRASMLGRRVSEIFPPDHAFQRALGIHGDALEPVDAVEVHREAGEPGAVSRMNVSVHIITERGPGPGERMGALVTLRDLDSLERIGSHLETSERLSAMGRVTAGVAHEVKNPLNAMTTWLGVLKEKMPRDGDADGQRLAQQALHVLESEIHRLDRVVKTFLDFTRPVELEFTEVALGELLEEVAAVARPQFQRAGVALEVGGTGDPATVRADRELLKQVALNLLLNAVEAISGARDKPARAPRVEVRLERRGEWLEFRVADNGPGIPPDKRDKVFQLFFTTRKGGSGIGLATAYRIVQFHHGNIEFETAASLGTTFRVRLPLLSALGRRSPGDAGMRVAAGPVPVGTAPGRGRADD